MHLPDGFLDLTTCVGATGLAGAGLVYASRQVAHQWTDRTIPMLGVMSAFVFAGQMVNFPIPGGTSGHLLGGVLATAVLGPAAATMALTVVLVVQCLFFQDGGVTTLGANILNLALVGVGAGSAVLRLGRPTPAQHPAYLLRLAVAAWASVVLGAMACGLELALSGTAPLRLVLPAMTITHAIIGVGEAMITVAVIAFLRQVRPDLLDQPAAQSAAAWPKRTVILAGLSASVGVVCLLLPLASSLPDGLERVAERLGFARVAQPAAPAPIPDYAIPGIGWPWLSTLLAGLVGILLTLLVAWVFGRASSRWRRPTSSGR